MGRLADLVVLPAGVALSEASRADIRLVMLGGAPKYADEVYGQALLPPESWTQIRVDGKAKLLSNGLAEILAAAQSAEPGVEMTAATKRVA